MHIYTYICTYIYIDIDIDIFVSEYTCIYVWSYLLVCRKKDLISNTGTVFAFVFFEVNKMNSRTCEIIYI